MSTDGLVLMSVEGLNGLFVQTLNTYRYPCRMAAKKKADSINHRP